MIRRKAIILIGFVVILNTGYTQRFNAGFVFQYHVFKQVDVKSPIVVGTHSHDLFNVKAKENQWKAFAAGQSILIGMMAQMDYKKFYLTTELSFNLNTYRYALYYPVAPSSEEKVIFETLYQQMEIPVYIGYQFQSSNLLRYSVFGGVISTVPLFIQTDFEEPENVDESLYDRYDSNDMRYILYNDDPYLSGLVGFVVHIASLAKVDLRYTQRLSSPGDQYDVKFNTIGVAFTYFLPLHLKKKKVYYEE